MIKQVVGLLCVCVAAAKGQWGHRSNEIHRGDHGGPEVRHVNEFSSTSGRRGDAGHLDHQVDELPEHSTLGEFDDQFDEIPEFSPKYANKQYLAEGSVHEDHVVAELDLLDDDHDDKYPKMPVYKHKYASDDDKHDEVDTEWEDHVVSYNPMVQAPGLHSRAYPRTPQPHHPSYLPRVVAYGEPQIVHHHYHSAPVAHAAPFAPMYAPSTPAGVPGWSDEVYRGLGNGDAHARDEREYIARASWKRVEKHDLKHDSNRVEGSRQGKAFTPSVSYNNQKYNSYPSNYGYGNQVSSSKRINHSHDSNKSTGYGNHGSSYNTGYGNNHGSSYNTGYGNNHGSSYNTGYGNNHGSSYNTGYGNNHGSSYNTGYGNNHGSSYNTGYGNNHGSSYNTGYGNNHGSSYKNGYGNNHGSSYNTGYGNNYVSSYNTGYGNYGSSYNTGYGNHYNTGYDNNYGSSYNPGYGVSYNTGYGDKYDNYTY